MKSRPAIDATVLPDQGFRHHAPFWWGSTYAILLEAAGFVTLLVTYFYVRRSFDTWPPTGTVVPDLGVSTINVVVLVVSILPMWHAAHLAMRFARPRLLGFWLLLCFLFGIAAAVLRVMEFKGVHTRWNSNAYGAIVWAILAVHFAHILAATLETLVLGVLMVSGPVEDKHFVDVINNATYWYFMALSWVAFYAIAILGPRLL
jgi:heme/copper-type cytochrome/quinol oxidase subunit 3